MNTWIISPNGWAWALLGIVTFSLGAIALRMWYTPKNGIKWNISSDSNKIHIGIGEFYKTTILTAWLAFSAWMMWRVCNISMATDEADFWSKIIAIIGIIVATLIGWQIYSAMDWNSKADRITKMEDGFCSLMSEIRTNRNFSEASVLYINARNLINEADEDPENSKESFEGCYKMLLKAISLYTAPSVEQQIEDCIGWMYSVVESMERHGYGKDEDFQEECDKLFTQIKSNKHHLTIAQQGKLKGLESRRKGLKNNSNEDVD